MSTVTSIPPHSPRRISSRFAQLAHDAARRRRLLLILGLFAFGIVAGLAALARLYTVLPIDVWFTRELQENQSTVVARFMYGVSIFGYNPWSMITIAVGAIGLALAVGWREGVYLFFVTVAQGLINVGIKLAIGRPRPVSGVVDVFVPEQGNSFPSGHVMFYTVFFGLLLFFVFSRMPHTRLRSLIAIVLGTLIALVGPARIILGSHWLSDVIAAYLIGLLILAASIELYLVRFVQAEGRAAKSQGVDAASINRES